VRLPPHALTRSACSLLAGSQFTHDQRLRTLAILSRQLGPSFATGVLIPDVVIIRRHDEVDDEASTRITAKRDRELAELARTLDLVHALPRRWRRCQPAEVGVPVLRPLTASFAWILASSSSTASEPVQSATGLACPCSAPQAGALEGEVFVRTGARLMFLPSLSAHQKRVKVLLVR